jgi:phospholipid/cholesterol/gamma-HCH transport system ATP-binding protein
MIRVENLCRAFDGNTVLRDVSFDVARGELVALIGRSGGGKSVLLKHMAGLKTPDCGRVLIGEQDIHGMARPALKAFRERLGFLFQGGALFDSMTVFENVAFPLREKRLLNAGAIREKVRTELDHVGLSGTENKYPSQLSGGMIKRAALARALVQEPEVMFFDEPTTGLDPVMGRAILRLIHSSHERLSFTGVIVTHMIPRVFDIIDRVIMLKKGTVGFDGTPADFMSSNDAEARGFLDEPVVDAAPRRV